MVRDKVLIVGGIELLIIPVYIKWTKPNLYTFGCSG